MLETRMCVVCQAPYEARQTKAKYCSSTCRSRASRGVKVAPVVTISDPAPVTDSETDPVGPVESALLSELTEVDRETTSLGRAALALARRIDDGRDMGNGLAALVKQLEATMNAATADVRLEQSPLDRGRDELARRRAVRGA